MMQVTIQPNQKGQENPGGRKSDIKIFEDKVVLIEKVFQRTAKNAILGVCAYVLLDTFRKVVVQQTAK
jgi:hypothetical protein